MYYGEKYEMYTQTELGTEYEVLDERLIPPGQSQLQLPKVERREWGAHNNRGQHIMRHPARIVVDHFTYTDRCHTKDHCMEEVLKMQEADLAIGLTDIKYNFLIGNDGNIYEGRGFFHTPSRALVKLNKLFRKRLDIAFIGDYTDGIPELMWRKRLQLIHYCERFNVLRLFHNVLSIRRGDWLSTIDENRRAALRKKKEEAQKKANDNNDPDGFANNDPAGIDNNNPDGFANNDPAGVANNDPAGIANNENTSKLDDTGG